MNIELIREKVSQNLRNEGVSDLRIYFRRFCSGTDDKFWTRRDFSSFIKKLGFDYDDEQIEELFIFLDRDKDYRLSAEELSLSLENKPKSKVKYKILKNYSICKVELF